MSFFGGLVSGLGKIAAPIYHAGATIGGGVGGFMLGGPQGAMAGARLGDKWGNIGQDALSGRNVGASVKRNALGVAEGGAGLYGAHAMQGGGSGYSGGTEGSVPQVTRNGIPSSVGDLIGTTGSADDPHGTSSGGWLRDAVGSVMGGGGQPPGGQPPGEEGPNKWLMGLAGLQGLNSAYLGNKASNMSNQALKNVQGSYDQRAGLRTAGISGMLNPQTADLSGLTKTRSAIPYLGAAQPNPVLPPPRKPLMLAAGGTS